MQVRSLAQEDPLEEGMAIHSSMLAWRISRTEEPGRLHPWGHKVSDRTEATARALLEGEGNMSIEDPLCVRPCAFCALNHLIFRTREMQVRPVPGA